MLSHEKINQMINEQQHAHDLTVLVPSEPKTLPEELFEAIKCDKTHEVKQLLIAKVDPNSRNEKGITPIMVAALQKNVEILKSLIFHKADVTSTDTDDQTVLHKASEEGYHELFDTLLEAKADINCRTKDGKTPLYTAVYNGWVETTKYLLAEKANPNISRANGWSPLLSSAFDGYERITQSLIDAKANVHQSYHSLSPLYYAAYKGHLNIVKMLVAAGAKISLLAQSDKGLTPLMIAAQAGKLDVVKYLLEEGADPNIESNDETALYAAVSKEQPEIVRVLLEYKSSPDQQFSSGKTLLRYAQDKHNKAIEEALNNAGVSHIPNGQGFFVEPMQKTGLKGNKGGVCYGLVCEAMQDYFSVGLQKLYRQLESIARTPIDEFKSFDSILKNNRKEWLKRAMAEVSNVLTRETGGILTAETLWLNKLTVGEIKILLDIKEKWDEQTLREKFSRFLTKKVYEKIRAHRDAEIRTHPELEIPYLFEEVDAYYDSLEYRDWYPKGS